jgi:hypothetical protein
MSYEALLLEVNHLEGVGTRLEGLADMHPSLFEKLTGIAASVRNAAALLAVLVMTATQVDKKPEIQ